MPAGPATQPAELALQLGTECDIDAYLADNIGAPSQQWQHGSAAEHNSDAAADAGQPATQQPLHFADSEAGNTALLEMLEDLPQSEWNGPGAFPASAADAGAGASTLHHSNSFAFATGPAQADAFPASPAPAGLGSQLSLSLGAAGLDASELAGADPIDLMLLQAAGDATMEARRGGGAGAGGASFATGSMVGQSVVASNSMAPPPPRSPADAAPAFGGFAAFLQKVKPAAGQPMSAAGGSASQHTPPPASPFGRPSQVRRHLAC